MPPSFREFKAAEGQLRESVAVRSDLPDHTYPRKREDLDTINRFVNHYGLPPAGAIRGFLWWLFLGGGR